MLDSHYTPGRHGLPVNTSLHDPSSKRCGWFPIFNGPTSELGGAELCTTFDVKLLRLEYSAKWLITKEFSAPRTSIR